MGSSSRLESKEIKGGSGRRIGKMIMNSKFLFFILLPAVSSQSFARVHVETQDKSIVLIAEPCSDANKQLSALVSWKKHIGETYSLPFKFEAEKQCKVDITPLIPDRLRDLYEKIPVGPGPNCWNACLTINKIVSEFRYSSASEFNYWVSSPLCKLIENKDIQSGDIVAIRTLQEGEEAETETHGFIYLTPELSFSKNGFIEGRYRIQDTGEIEKLYNLKDPECRFLNARTKKCHIYSQAYRCESLESHLAGEIQDIENILEPYRKVECSLSDRALFGPISEVGLEEIHKSLIEISSKVKAEIETSKRMPKELKAVVLDGLRVNYDSLKEQMVKIRSEANSIKNGVPRSSSPELIESMGHISEALIFTDLILAHIELWRQESPKSFKQIEEDLSNLDLLFFTNQKKIEALKENLTKNSPAGGYKAEWLDILDPIGQHIESVRNNLLKFYSEKIKNIQ